MIVPFVFRCRVQHDLDAAFNWYEEQQAGLGEEFLSVVQSTFKSIEFYPQMFATFQEEVRRAIVSRCTFAAIYVVEPKRDVVLRVLHSARDPKLWPSPKQQLR